MIVKEDIVFFCTFICVASSMLLMGAGAAPSDAPGVPLLVPACFPAIFALGDSLTDTGNANLSVSGNGTAALFLRLATEPPYGETFPGHPFSRYSDGRLIIDFLTRYLGFSGFLNPYLNSSADFTDGVNYAVAGATAENVEFLASRGIFPVTPLSLDVQVDWHLAVKASVDAARCKFVPAKPPPRSFYSGLYVIGIGGNDYISAFASGLYSASEINVTFVPSVIAKIRNATEILYSSGARKFLFISITPLGCSPAILSSSAATRDTHGCVKDVNSVAYNHGIQLLQEVKRLQASHPDGLFMFLDYYGAYEFVLENSNAFGFKDTLDACCGAPRAPYHFNSSAFCSSLSLGIMGALCNNPNAFLNWDGFHFTDAFNKEIFNQTIFTGTYMHPPHGLALCARVDSIV